MEKWEVKVFDQKANYLVEADFIESVPNGTLVFWRWTGENKTKKIAVAIFSSQNLISAIRVKEE